MLDDGSSSKSLVDNMTVSRSRVLGSKLFLYITSAAVVAIIALGGYSFYLKEVLGNTENDLRLARAQLEFLQEQKEKDEKALSRQIAESAAIRQELIEALRRAREDKEYQEWAPNRLPQIIIDDFKAPR
jgi:uncharacterized protein HemX